MTVGDVISRLESLAPPSLQESYDNAGLICGDAAAVCTGIIVALDSTEDVVLEAIRNNCNMVVAHHPIVFRGIKKLTGKNYVERTLITAIKNDIAIFAIHTNLDNISAGVSQKMASAIGLENTRILAPKADQLCKLYTFVPNSHAEKVRDAVFSAGGGQIGKYAECSFSSEGIGSFKAGEGTNPYAGKKGELHFENETKLEIIFPVWAEREIIKALLAAHPYEEVAYDIIALQNEHPGTGSGIVGELAEAMEETAFLALLARNFDVPVIRHTRLRGRMVKKVAVCAGAGSFLIPNALAEKVDFFISGDFKYHEFFDADGRITIADIGHFESEQQSIDLLLAFLQENFRTFATLKTTVRTNPVLYYKT
ncbi:MAG: Nif3-like dinuclear metal center hexameric protein [Gemmatimonadaceae bacterium]|nr:Nif3-like dinuclear metal center hexameric protein [Chitinophagaceae bacterium]